MYQGGDPADSYGHCPREGQPRVKERLRSTVHGLLFKRIPKLLFVHIVADAVRCLNQFPWRNGISRNASPISIVTGAATPDYNCMRVELGQYVQVFEPSDPTNTPKAWSLGAVALTSTGNADHGDYYFLCLATGARISRHQWTVIPITDTHIARVEALAKNKYQPLIQARGLLLSGARVTSLTTTSMISTTMPTRPTPFKATTRLTQMIMTTSFLTNLPPLPWSPTMLSHTRLL